MYLSISLKKSNLPHNRQLIVYYYQSKYEVGDVVGELIFQNSSMNTLCQMKSYASSDQKRLALSQTPQAFDCGGKVLAGPAISLIQLYVRIRFP